MTFRDRLKATFSDALAASKNADQHTHSYYTDQATLEFNVDCADVDREISLLAQDASRKLSAPRPSTPTTSRRPSREPRGCSAAPASSALRHRPRMAAQGPRPAPGR